MDPARLRSRVVEQCMQLINPLRQRVWRQCGEASAERRYVRGLAEDAERMRPEDPRPWPRRVRSLNEIEEEAPCLVHVYFEFPSGHGGEVVGDSVGDGGERLPWVTALGRDQGPECLLADGDGPDVVGRLIDRRFCNCSPQQSSMPDRPSKVPGGMRAITARRSSGLAG